MRLKFLIASTALLASVPAIAQSVGGISISARRHDAGANACPGGVYEFTVFATTTATTGFQVRTGNGFVSGPTVTTQLAPQTVRINCNSSSCPIPQNINNAFLIFEVFDQNGVKLSGGPHQTRITWPSPSMVACPALDVPGSEIFIEVSRSGGGGHSMKMIADTVKMVCAFDPQLSNLHVFHFDVRNFQEQFLLLANLPSARQGIRWRNASGTAWRTPDGLIGLDLLSSVTLPFRITGSRNNELIPVPVVAGAEYFIQTLRIDLTPFGLDVEPSNMARVR